MATETEMTAVGIDIRPVLDHRGFPLETAQQKQAKIKTWVDRIDVEAVAELAAQHYSGFVDAGKHVRGRVVGQDHGKFNACFFVELDIVDDGPEDSEDGIKTPQKAAKWVVRIPIPVATMNENPWPKLKSEIATMK